MIAALMLVGLCVNALLVYSIANDAYQRGLDDGREEARVRIQRRIFSVMRETCDNPHASHEHRSGALTIVRRVIQ